MPDDEKKIKKNIARLKSPNLLMNKIVLIYINLIMHANHALLGFY